MTLYDGAGGFSLINAGAGGEYELGPVFTVTADRIITGLSWYRCSTGANQKPEIVRLWRVGDSTELGRLTTVPDDGAAGWQGADLDTPITVVSGQEYCVAGYFANSGGQPSSASASGATGGFSFASNHRRYHSPAGASGFPGNADNGSYIGLDVLLVALGGGGGDTDPTGTHGEWFSSTSGTNTHHDDLPWRTDANVTTLRGEAEGASGFAAIKGVVDTIATNVGTMLTRWSAALATTVQTTSDNVATLLTRWSASLATALQTMSDNFATFFSTTGGTAGGPTGALSGRTAFPTVLWTLADETDFEFQISWDVPADLYTISLSGVPVRINTVDVDGATWRPRVGWWALRNGDLLGARRFLSWENEYVEDGGRRMPGIVIRTQPEIAGHVQAWRLT